MEWGLGSRGEGEPNDPSTKWDPDLPMHGERGKVGWKCGIVISLLRTHPLMGVSKVTIFGQAKKRT